jgi:hypothetical protein
MSNIRDALGFIGFIVAIALFMWVFTKLSFASERYSNCNKLYEAKEMTALKLICPDYKAKVFGDE